MAQPGGGRGGVGGSAIDGGRELCLAGVYMESMEYGVWRTEDRTAVEGTVQANPIQDSEFRRENKIEKKEFREEAKIKVQSSLVRERNVVSEGENSLAGGS